MAIKTYTKEANKQLTANFNSREFDCKCGKYCSETLIDEKLVEYLQKIRDHFGKPITITSGYRCATHNKNVGGASTSYHSRGQATDIVVSGVKPLEVAQYAESIGIKGIGLYDTFTHIDTRTTKSFWYSEKQEKRETFITSSNNSTTSGSTAVSKITVSLPNLQTGDKNKYVRMAQSMLGITDDGVYGKQTALAVYNFQKKVGLVADKTIGKDTWIALFKAL